MLEQHWNESAGVRNHCQPLGRWSIAQSMVMIQRFDSTPRWHIPNFKSDRVFRGNNVKIYCRFKPSEVPQVGFITLTTQLPWDVGKMTTSSLRHSKNLTQNKALQFELESHYWLNGLFGLELVHASAAIRLNFFIFIFNFNSYHIISYKISKTVKSFRKLLLKNISSCRTQNLGHYKNSH